MEKDEKQRKSSQAKIDGNLRYKRKCKTKTLEFKPTEFELLEYAEHTAEKQGQSFQGYVKSLIRDDMTSE